MHLTLKTAIILFVFFGILGRAPVSFAQSIPWGELRAGTELSAKERQMAQLAMRSIPCYLGCKGTVAQCLSAEPRCKTAWRLANYIVFLAGMTLNEEEIGKIITQRKESVLPAKVHNISLAGAPWLGDPKAKVVLVEYADFQCSHCAATSPLLAKLVQQMKGRVVLYFKPYPLRPSGGPLLSAQAALAAQQQGKFWEMAHLLFANPESHTPAGVEGLAKKIGMDLGKFRAAMKDVNILKQIEHTKIEGVRLGIKGAPTLFFNGKQFHLPKDEKHLWDRVEEELEVMALTLRRH